MGELARASDIVKQMPAAVASIAAISAETAELALVGGDLSGLNSGQRLELLNAICRSLHINPLTRPFEYLELDKKIVLYARKDATEQLRSARNVSLKIVNSVTVEGVYSVTAQATLPSGRFDEAIGAVPLVKERGQWKTGKDGKRFFERQGGYDPLPPEARANAIMKAETKAKRRVTLSICGLGMLDESQLEDVGRYHVMTDEDLVTQQTLPLPPPDPQASHAAPPDKTPAQQLDPFLQGLLAGMKDRDSVEIAINEVFAPLAAKIGDGPAIEAFGKELEKHGVEAWQKLPTIKAVKKLLIGFWPVAQELMGAADQGVRTSAHEAVEG